MSIFYFCRPPVIGGDGFVFQRIDEVGGAGGVSISTCYIGAGEGIGIAAAAHFDGLSVRCCDKDNAEDCGQNDS